MKLTADKAKAIAILAGGAVLLFIAWKAYKAGGAVVDTVTHELNPASPDNIIYDGLIGGAGRAITGDEDFSLGVWLFEVTHPNAP
jgi:hypothetical protein